MEEEQKLKKEIIKSAEIVKKKVKQIKEHESENNNILETMFKPITEPLNQIATQKVHNLQEEIEKSERPTEILPKKYRYSISDHAKPSDNNYFVKTETPTKNPTIQTDEFKECESDYDIANDDSNESCCSDKIHSYSRNTLLPINPDIERPSSCSPNASVHTDVPFGVRNYRDKQMLGSCQIQFSNKIVSVPGYKCNETPGLLELLLKKTPDVKVIKPKDLDNYKKLLLITNAHRRDFEPNKPIKSNRGMKYLQIIKPMFQQDRVCRSNENITKGFGLPLMKKMKKNTDYVYWDDPNELVERLKLLVASRDAGNTGLDGEIISILQELRGAGYIK